MNLSPSRVLKGQTCMRQVYFHYKLGIKNAITSANLAFGKAVDQTTMDYLQALSEGRHVGSMESLFLQHWEKETSISLEYSATHSEGKMRAMGTKMAEQFPEAWERSGLMVFTMPDGSPALQVKLKVQITDQDTLGGYLDLIAMNQEGKIIIIDIKTTGVAYDEVFTLQSDQLTAYQLLVDTHAESLGIEQADEVGFMCLHKKTEPVIHQPQIAPRRSKQRVQEYLGTCMNYINDYNSGRFNRTSLGAFNSPCNLCDFRLLCSQGITDDLIIPDSAQSALAQLV